MSSSTRPVVCASDLGEGSDEAIRQADALARSTGSPLHVIHVLSNAFRHHPLFPQLYPRESSELATRESVAAELLSRRVATLTGRLTEDFRTQIDVGIPYAEIVRDAEALDAQLVVVGGRQAGDAGSRLFDDTAENVVRHAHGPVLVARPPPVNGGVLAATDLSDPSLPAVAAAARAAERDGLRLTVLHVLDLRVPLMGLALELPPGGFVDLPTQAVNDLRSWSANRLDEALRQCGAEGVPLVQEGAPAEVILRVSRELPAGLIVMGTVGLTGIRRIVLGSVAAEVVRRATCSVLVVRLNHTSSPSAR